MIRLGVAGVVSALIVTSACGGKNIPVFVAQSGLAVSQAVGQIQMTTKQLTDNGTIPPAVALKVQEGLLVVNKQLLPLPELLRTIERLQQAGDTTLPVVDQAIGILTFVGQDLSIVIAGVPIGELTQPLITLVRTAQQTVITTLIELAKLRGAEGAP